MVVQMTLNPASTVAQIESELERLEDPRMRAVNEKQGNDFGVNLTKLRGLAKTLKSNQELALDLWQTQHTTSRLLALLVCKPKSFTRDELDAWVRQTSVPKVLDWFMNYVVKKNKHLEELRQQWLEDPDPIVASCGWDLTAHQVVKAPDLLDLTMLLDTIETQMKDAPERLQWMMNNTLALIGINHPELRARALAIGESLQVLADHPTSPGCTSPFAPIWINEMVKRQKAAANGG